MREEKVNIWDMHKNNKWICITTNSYVKLNGELVMGRGCAKEARDRFPDIAKRLGTVYYQTRFEKFPPVIILKDLRIIAFPTKCFFKHPAKLDIIENSCKQLMYNIEARGIKEVYLPRPGCGYGALSWEKEVKPLIATFLDDRVIVVTI
jgi:hypothetical protein